MGGAGENGQPRRGQAVQLAHLSAVLGAEQLQRVLVAHAVGIADHHEDRRLDTRDVRGPIVGLQIDADHLFTNSGNRAGSLPNRV